MARTHTWLHFVPALMLAMSCNADAENVAAVIVHLEGPVLVTPAGGAAYPAALNHGLTVDDTVEPQDGFALLLLRNKHVVRVDDVGPLRVGDIIALGAKETKTPIATQVAALQFAGEKITVDERAAGWRHMRRAAETALRARDDEAGAARPQKAPQAEMPPAPGGLGAVGGGGRVALDAVHDAAPAPPVESKTPSEKARQKKESSKGSEPALAVAPADEPDADSKTGISKERAVAPPFTMRIGAKIDNAKNTEPQPASPSLIELRTVCASDDDAMILVVKGGTIVKIVLPRGRQPSAQCKSRAAATTSLSDGVIIVEKL